MPVPVMLRLVVAVEIVVAVAVVAAVMGIEFFGRVGMLPTPNLGTATRRPSHDFTRTHLRQIFDCPIRLMPF